MVPPQLTLDIGFAHDRTTGKEDWLTPPYILRALGRFNLDPCAPEPRPWDMAAAHFTIHQNGLNQPWHGRVWLNPPYGNETDKWVRRLAEHGDGIALIFARTETATFHPWVWEHADAMLFLKGRVRFYTREGRQGGSSGAPSVLIASGRENGDALGRSGLSGKYVALAKDRMRAKPTRVW
jgi:hypothetical protein